MLSTVLGETPAAFLALRPGGADSEAVRIWANDHPGKAQRIALALPIGELPRSPIGKVLKRDLRERLPPAHPL